MAALPAAAQEPVPPLTLRVAPETGELVVRLGGILDDGVLERALHSGLPIRVLLDAELWKDGFFDSQKGEAQWRATVLYDPLARSYRIETAGGEAVAAVTASLAEADSVLARPLRLPVRPDEAGRWYWVVAVEVETLSLSDLEELRRWLRGDLGPAVAGEDQVDNAMARGVRRLVVRVLGLPVRRYRDRTPTFAVGEGAGPG